MVSARWSDGYMTDIEYESFFFTEQAPALLDFVCLQMARRAPAIEAPYTYCELGCGMGLTTLILAATNPAGRFWGVDFNPAHVVNARRLAEEAGLDNVTFVEANFGELARHDLPPMDYVTSHGVWSWVSDEVRGHVLGFLRDRLVPGGAFYVSYNCAVGWEGIGVVGRLLKEYVLCSSGPLDQRIEHGIFQLNELAEREGGYFASFPTAKRWLERLSESSMRYLAHEYLNEHWRTYHHADVARQLGDGAKLSFVGSADVMRNFDRYSLSENGLKQAQRHADPVLTEELKDLETGWGLRRDVYLRGAPVLSHDRALDMLSTQQFVSLVERTRFEPKIVTPLGETTVNAELLTPIADAFCQGPCSLADLLAGLDVPDTTFFDVLLICTILTQNGMIVPVSRHPVGDGERARTLNRLISRHAALGESLPFLAAPVSGGAIGAGPLDVLCYELLADGFEGDASQLGERMLAMMGEGGSPPTKDGKPVTVADVSGDMETLLDVKLPVWRRLGVI
jgi:SAM-dependent methyltransferase